MVFPASLRLLVSATSRPNRLSPGLTATRLRAVPLPAITPRAHHHLASASVAAQQSPVARRIRCLSHGQRAGCESARKALYSPRGARPPWTAAGLVFNVPVGPLPVFFSAAYYPSTHSSPSTHTHRFATSIDDAALRTTAPNSQNHAGLRSRSQVAHASRLRDGCTRTEGDQCRRDACATKGRVLWGLAGRLR